MIDEHVQHRQADLTQHRHVWTIRHLCIDKANVHPQKHRSDDDTDQYLPGHIHDKGSIGTWKHDVSKGYPTDFHRLPRSRSRSLLLLLLLLLLPLSAMVMYRVVLIGKITQPNASPINTPHRIDKIAHNYQPHDG
jgi:hypothetical protein